MYGHRAEGCAALTGCLDWLLHLVFDNFLKTRCWFKQHQCGRGEFMRHRIHLCVTQKKACLQMPAMSVDHTCLVLKPKTNTVWHSCFHRACLSYRKSIFSLNPRLSSDNIHATMPTVLGTGGPSQYCIYSWLPGNSKQIRWLQKKRVE